MRVTDFSTLGAQAAAELATEPLTETTDDVV